MKKSNKFLMTAIPLAFVLFGLVLYEYGYLAVQSEVAAQEETVFAKKKLLRSYLAVIAEKPRIEEELAALKESRKAEGSKIVEAPTPSIAAAALQSAVRDMIVLRGGSISSERVEKPEDGGTFKIITIAVDAVLPDIRALSDALYAIETQTPYLVVRELDATVRNYREPKDLTIRIKVSGLTGGMK
jgi:hypothetical protein